MQLTDLLVEKKMAPSSYGATMRRLADDAKIGFEIEVLVPGDTFFHRDADDVAPDSQHVSELKTLSEFENLFKLSKQQRGSIENDFSSWQVQQEDDWVEEHWDNYLDSDVEQSKGAKAAEQAARRDALNNAKNRFSWHKWFADTFEDVDHFVAHYELSPMYGWADKAGHVNKAEPESAGYNNGWRKTATELASHLGNVLKQRVLVNGPAGKYTSWNLTHDTSIKDNDDKDYESDPNGYGIEIVSPPLPPMKAMEQLKIVFDVLDQYDISTNESTGIHVNISLPAADMASFDPLKLVLFMGDQHVLAKFGRQANAFTRSQHQVVQDSILATGTIPKSVPELMKLGREGLSETGKQFSVNLNHLPKYLEFRAAGGQDYHKRFTDIQEVVGRWLSAVEIAADPSRNRREYLKKVSKLFDPEANIVDLAKSATFEEVVRKADGKFALDNFEDALATSRDTPSDEAKIKVARAVLLIFLQLSSVLKTLPEASLNQCKDARALIKRAGLSAHEVLDEAKSRENAQQALAAMKKYKLL